MERKTLIVLILGVLIILGFIAVRNLTDDHNLTRCYTQQVYKEIDSMLLPVDTDDKARKVIENTFSSLNLTAQYKENYEIESYEKYGGQKNPGPPYNIIISGYDERFSILNDGTVERTRCAR